ncbi:MAG: maltose alpha-D-glucosyltransferase [Alphaproteobacteria bacterium]|nr:maltose alpha-D-glucosyltransferase [Alphaproteobacteria bacterium]
MENDPLWFKDAVIYQLHVKSFFDADDDGIGDFSGLTRKLDYVRQLGVDTLWLLPFYPSPLRDDGYDISDYRNVNPAYGTMRDFRALVREAHARDIRIVIELVINHTSDQHPWFQRARRARPGSRARDFYVWSDNDRKYSGTRIIFTDTERSNWAWDEVAGAYYWHRFFSHQPDLNFDNPRVVREVIASMRHWLDMGVDGLRLDAVPYLCEREGTNNENLPETHAVLKRLRQALDESHPGRLFLAEANQWPEDVLPYFADGDECHMAFHFPLMPRMYMAMAREDRHPITDIMRQTPEIPANCQWAIFLRNHDELTLEMVTDRERDYLWETYAADPRARVNVGIRRRLAPLMQNDRRKIELLNSLLLSMPGTPIIYYGDELGMGDNIFLGDRNGVRTPMQWSEDRNGGFSRADPARLFLPPIMDPVYGYRAINVEAQLRSTGSLLNWTRRLIAVRRGRKTFGRGGLRFLYPKNRKILAYLREWEGEVVLCVANLAASAQGAELDLSEFENRVPIELLGSSPFPPIGALPYFLTLPAYGFYWFTLATETAAPGWHEPWAHGLPELVTLVTRGGWPGVFTGAARRGLEKDILPAWLPNQRWFAEKDASIQSIEVLRHAELRTDERSWMLTLLALRRGDGVLRNYMLPLAMTFEAEGEAVLAANQPSGLGRLRDGPRLGLLYEALADEDFALALVEGARTGRVLPGSDGQVACFATSALDQIAFDGRPAVRSLRAEQSNTSVIIGDAIVLKLIRRPEEGVNPEMEVGRFLTEVAAYPYTPPLLGGFAAIDSAGRGTLLGMMHGFVANQGDAWGWVTSYLKRFMDESSLLPPDEVSAAVAGGIHADFLSFVETLGRRTAELHRALGMTTGDRDFDPEPVTEADLMSWRRRAAERIEAALLALRGSDLPAAAVPLAQAERLRALPDQLIPAQVEAHKTRLHGDYHLGQVLVVKNDVTIIDFEGEPVRPLAERRAKDSPLRDVAGMLRSFDYAARSTLMGLAASRPTSTAQFEGIAGQWEDLATAAFLTAWGEGMRGCATPQGGEDETRTLLRLFLIEKACYEVSYEAANRPGWLGVPLEGLIRLLEGD